MKIASPDAPAPDLTTPCKHPSGFSLVEVLAAITIIGIVTFMAIPNIVQMKQDGEENLVRARAETLNLAIASYVQAVGATAAQSAWTAAGNNEARYSLIAPYIAFSHASLSNGFIPSGYSATLPASINPMTTKTVISGPSGTIAY